MKKFRLMSLLVMSLAITASWAEKLEQPNVIYQKKPSGRIYGSDGSITDTKPSFPNKVYDSDGKAYPANLQTIPNSADSIAKPLPRTTIPVGRSTGVRAGVGGVRR